MGELIQFPLGERRGGQASDHSWLEEVVERLKDEDVELSAPLLCSIRLSHLQRGLESLAGSYSQPACADQCERFRRLTDDEWQDLLMSLPEDGPPAELQAHPAYYHAMLRVGRERSESH